MLPSRSELSGRVLVGSADCKPFRHGGDGLDNPMLAQNRAQAVSEWLKPEMDSRRVRVEVVPLDQHKSCRESEELRAVYPSARVWFWSATWISFRPLGRARCFRT